MRFRTADDAPWVDAQTRNIGVGGAFLVSPELQPVGSTLTLELVLPTSDRVFVLPSIVRWSAAGDGMGVQFVGVDIDVLLELNEMFAAG